MIDGMALPINKALLNMLLAVCASSLTSIGGTYQIIDIIMDEFIQGIKDNI